MQELLNVEKNLPIFTWFCLSCQNTIGKKNKSICSFLLKYFPSSYLTCKIYHTQVMLTYFPKLNKTHVILNYQACQHVLIHFGMANFKYYMFYSPSGKRNKFFHNLGKFCLSYMYNLHFSVIFSPSFLSRS